MSCIAISLHALGQAHGRGEQIATGVLGRIAMYRPNTRGPLHKLVDDGDGIVGMFPNADDARHYTNTGVRQARGLAKQARQRGVGRTPKTPAGHVWRRTVIFIVLGLGVGVIVNRALKTRHHAEVVEVPTPSISARSPKSESTPYHTVTSDSAGGVYHDREDCPAGKRILSEHRVSGTGGRDRCKDCETLAS
jgi:hypothetical protein